MKASDQVSPRVRPRCPQRLALMQAAKQFGIWHGELMIAMDNGELPYERDGDELFTTAAACEEYQRRQPARPMLTPLS